MTWPETVLVGAAVLLALAMPVPERHRTAAVTGTAALVLAAAVTAALLDGPRWQWLPVASAAALAVAVALVPRRPRRGGSRAPEWTAAVAALGLAASGGLAMWALPVVDFPEPSGAYAVGTATVQWTDPGRDESWTDDPGDRRTVVAQLWYPAEPGTGTGGAPYLGRTADEARVVTDGIADSFGLPGFLLSDAARARTPARVGADVARAPEPFPVVVFSPGLGGVRGQNTAWAQELASHGHVVAALDHPYDSAAVVLDDGTVLRGRLTVPEGPREEDRLVSEWTSIRAEDMRLALTRLRQMAAADDGPFAGRLDPGAAVAAGHSLGGAAALHAADRDDRFTAAVDIDGFPHGVEALDFPRPLLVLVAGAGTGNEANDARYADAVSAALAAGGGGCALTVPGAAHLSFTDAPLYLPPVPALVGSSGRTEPLSTTAAATLAFLDAVRDGTPPSSDDASPGGAPASLDDALSPFGPTECAA
jgi:predicted dienelactone hydrolase